MIDTVELHCKDATNIFLEPNSINLFFINPSYVGSNIEEYGGPADAHINKVSSAEEYIDRLVKVAKHIEYALAPNGSAFIMLQNEYNIVPRLSNQIAKETALEVGQLFVWDFSSTELFKDLRYEKMGLIIHLYKDSFYVDENEREYVVKIPIDPFAMKKYDHLGFTENNIPEELYEKFIVAFSKEGDTVADIFGGTGTAAVSSIRLGRKAVYNDIAKDQYEIAKARIQDMEKDGTKTT
jgi:DNA modification methylase